MDNDETPIDVYMEQRRVAFKVGEILKAVDRHTNGIAQNPTNTPLSSKQQIAYLKKNIYNATELDPEMCTDLKPKWSMVWWIKETLQIENFEYQVAKEAFREGLKHSPGDNNCATGLERASRYASALQFFKGPGEMEINLHSQ